jgi:RimJ/RimL family protein N-acetyltransferase
MERVPPHNVHDEPVTVRGRWVNLRPVLETDYPTLYAWRVDAQFMALWQTAGRRVPSYQEYRLELERFLADGLTLLAVERATGTVLGFGRAYNINLVDGWAWVQAYATEQARLRPFLVGEAAALFANYLFTMFPLRKLCAEVFAYNETSLRLQERLGFRECGRLPEYVWYNGQLWDSVLYVLTRDAWLETSERFRILLAVEHQTEQLLSSR